MSDVIKVQLSELKDFDVSGKENKQFVLMDKANAASGNLTYEVFLDKQKRAAEEIIKAIDAKTFFRPFDYMVNDKSDDKELTKEIIKELAIELNDEISRLNHGRYTVEEAAFKIASESNSNPKRIAKELVIAIDSNLLKAYGADGDLSEIDKDATSNWSNVKKKAFYECYQDDLVQWIATTRYINPWGINLPRLVKSEIEKDTQSSNTQLTISTYEPSNAIGKLAVKAAIEIEKDTQRRATALQVLTLLQNWADHGNEPDVLIKSDIRSQAVIWVTDKQNHKHYYRESCRKTLKRFNDGRQ